MAAPGSAEATRLVGTTGPGQTITLEKDGRDVVYLKRGRYTITVRDRSSKHSFVLSGPWARGVQVPRKTVTSLRFVGRKTVTVTLTPGLYHYLCSAHGGYPGPFRTNAMQDSFRVE